MYHDYLLGFRKRFGRFGKPIKPSTMTTYQQDKTDLWVKYHSYANISSKDPLHQKILDNVNGHRLALTSTYGGEVTLEFRAIIYNEALTIMSNIRTACMGQVEVGLGHPHPHSNAYNNNYSYHIEPDNYYLCITITSGSQFEYKVSNNDPIKEVGWVREHGFYHHSEKHHPEEIEKIEIVDIRKQNKPEQAT